jgi:acyl dehydratase
MNVEAVRNWRFEPHEIVLTPERAMLYALSIGRGRDPLDQGDLPFVYEKALKVMPTWAIALGLKGFWAQDPATGLDWVRMVLAEQGAVFHRPFPAEGRLISHSRIDEVVDKGAAVGALIFMETELREAESEDLYVTLSRTIMCRGDGGFGGPPGRTRTAYPTADQPPDAVCDLPTAPGQALLYRLNGDFNPLHADPEMASAAGFDRPILHGLCTLAVSAHALLKTECGYDPARLRSLRARFSSPVFPGETIRTEIWREDSSVRFRAIVLERGATVLNGGFSEISPSI